MTDELGVKFKQMRLFDINDFIQKTVQKSCYYIDLSNFVSIFYTYTKQALIEHEFNNNCKGFNKVNTFFLFETISYLSGLVLKDMAVLIFFQLITLLTSDNLSVFWCRYKLSGLIFHKKIIFCFHSFFLFGLIRVMHSLV